MSCSGFSINENTVFNTLPDEINYESIKKREPPNYFLHARLPAAISGLNAVLRVLMWISTMDENMSNSPVDLG